MNNGVNELRRSFLEFFESKGHLSKGSYSLVPENDNSLLLINAGMAPLKPYFTGQEVPPKTRMCTCQKCVRTGDIDNVGKTARHLTFFEMLGNFSFGDYFKKEALTWSWEYLTKVLGLSEDRLYPSIYGEDDEALKIWTDVIGVSEDRITKFYRDPETGECDNFWEHGAGPCGPCSEIYYDRGEKYGCGKPDCKVGCECDRYMEVWNNVFTQFNGDGKGNYEELENKNIDTGMGLERLAVVMQDVDSVFDIDTMKAIRDKVCEMCGKKYQVNEQDDVSIRLITDHIRSATFLVADGVSPSNEGRGYVLRRLIRRAARHGRMLGIKDVFLSKLSETVINESKDGYPELDEKKIYIFKVLTEEENRFNKTIDQGLNILEEMKAELVKNNSKVLPGEDAFKLYDTFGFPIDLTAEILAESGMSYDEEGFAKCMDQQRETARAARKETNYMGKDASVYEELDTSITTKFVGYTSLSVNSTIIALTTEDEVVDKLTEGSKGAIFVDKTPFYATMGGQIGDTGVIKGKQSVFTVTDTIKVGEDKVAHIGVVTKGEVNIGAMAKMEVDKKRRALIARNHSATHLLQKALREVLGEHVEQKGSEVSADRLRFDFSHFSAMTTEEIKKVEDIVNTKIRESLDVVTEEMSIDDAKKSGAMALFGEKYGDVVRVVKMGDFSVELCGGTHASNTSDIVAFKIISEGGVAAGTRRIEAITNQAVFEYFNELETKLNSVAGLLKTGVDNIEDKVKSLLKENKKLNSQIDFLKYAAAKDAIGDVSSEVEKVGDVNFIAMKLDNVDMNGLRDVGDDIKTNIGEGVIVLASATDGKVSLVVMATDEAVKKGAHAGNIVKEIAKLVGGGGGGRPNMAQAGGKNPAGIDECLAKAKDVLASQL
jgi:alanyl-tRNA synthetase